MSRAYWVKLSSSVSETVNAKDRSIHRIDLDAVVPEGEMSDLLEGALRDSGWERSEDGIYEKTLDDGVRLVWDLEAQEVQAVVEESEVVSRNVHVEGRGYDRSTARREAQRMLEQEEGAARDAITSEAAKLQQKLSETLEANETARVREINGVLQKTYAEALKRKAKRLGNVTSINESTNQAGEYQLTITISE